MVTWKKSPFKPGSLEDAVGRILLIKGSLTAEEISAEYNQMKPVSLGTISSVLVLLSSNGLLSRKVVRVGRRVLYSYSITKKGENKLKQGVKELINLWEWFPLPESK